MTHLADKPRYLVSLLVVKPKVLQIERFLDCSTAGLRHINVLILSLLGPLSFTLQQQSRSRTQNIDANTTKGVVRIAHNSLNICLFPPLFFFGALYYTDVMSTLAVVLHLWIRGHLPVSPTLWLRSPLLFVSGLICLISRQTNIFWTAIFPAMLDAVDVVTNNSDQAYLQGPQPGTVMRSDLTRGLPQRRDLRWADVARRSWSRDVLIDMPVTDAILDGKMPFGLISWGLGLYK